MNKKPGILFYFSEDDPISIPTSKLDLLGLRLKKGDGFYFDLEFADEVLLSLSLFDETVQGCELSMLGGVKYEDFPKIHGLAFQALKPERIEITIAKYLANCVNKLEVEYDPEYGLNFRLVLELEGRELYFENSISKKEDLFRKFKRALILTAK